MKSDRNKRATRGFALIQTVVTILGYTHFGFESSVLACVCGLLTAYVCQTGLRLSLIWEGKASKQPFQSIGSYIDFLLPAHIVALTINFFVYGGGRVGPTMMAVVLAITSKHLFLVNFKGRTQHFFNPANIGILATLVFFPSISIALPYQFHSGLGDFGDAVLPITIFVLGTFTNLVMIRRIPLVAGWLGAFIAQAVVRYFAFDVNILSSLGPATGSMAMLFTFYMITDPMTTPSRIKPQLVFGASIGILYGVLMTFNIVFGLFWAVFLTCAIRGCLMVWSERTQSLGVPKSKESDEPVLLAS